MTQLANSPMPRFSSSQITLTTLPGIPLIQPGDNLGEIILGSLDAGGMALAPGDVLALTSKIVSKAEGRLVKLDEVIPSPEAQQLAERCHKDPRLVQVILEESQEVSRLRPGLLIMRHRLGFVCANAGVDRSNVVPPAREVSDSPGETVLLLPADPDGSAAKLRLYIEEATGLQVAIVIVDSHGRPHRRGTIGVAIGAAGLPALEDWRGRPDIFGRPLQHTEVGLADQIASAASMLLGQAAEGTPVVLLRGVPFSPREGCAGELIRSLALDLYR